MQQGRANKLALPDSKVDITTLESWWTQCDGYQSGGNPNPHQFNGVMDKPSTVFDALALIAAIGRGSFQCRDGLYSAVLDVAQSTVVQHFSPRNSWGFKGTFAFPNLPQAIRVRWTNPALNWQADEIIVYADNPAGGQYDATNTTLYETLDLTASVTSQLQAWAEGRYHLAQGAQRPETYELSCDVENLVCQRGDVIRVGHDVIQQGLGWGRVKSVQLDGSGNCLGVTLDESSLAMSYGSSYAMRIRRSLDNSSLLENLANPTTLIAPDWTGAAFTFAAPIPAASPQPAVGDLAMFGLQGAESGQYLVTKIEPGKDLSAIITFVDYAPGVFAADANPPASMLSALVAAPPPVAPVVASIYSDDQHLIHTASGIALGRVMVGITPPASSLFTAGGIDSLEYEIRVSSTNGHRQRGAYSSGATYDSGDVVTYGGLVWVSIAGSNTGNTPGSDGSKWTLSVESTPWGIPARVPPSESLIIDNVEKGTVYDIQLRYIFHDGTPGPWSLQYAYTVRGQVTAPADPTAVAAAVTTKNDIQLTWTKPTALPGGFEHYEIRSGSGSCAISAMAQAGTTVTVTIASAPDGLQVGQTVAIAGCTPSGYNGAQVVTGVLSPTQFTFEAVGGLGAVTVLGTATCFALAAFLNATKKTKYLVVDPASSTTVYWVAALDKNGLYDLTPPSTTIAFTQQPYSLKTVIGGDIGPFTSGTLVIGPVSFTIPPCGGRLHVDWTVILLNGGGTQSVSAKVKEMTLNLFCAPHRTRLDSPGATHGFNASGHFDHLYAGGDVATVALIITPDGGTNLTVQQNDPADTDAVTFLDIQFHPSPN